MFPYPVGNVDAVAVAQGVNDGCDSAQVVAAWCEAVPPAVPARRCFDHRGPVGVVSARPLFAQLTKFDDTAAVVVVGHPARYLVSGDSRNEHGVTVRGVVCGQRDRSRGVRSGSENYTPPRGVFEG